jgi:hypothetical protein
MADTPEHDDDETGPGAGTDNATLTTSATEAPGDMAGDADDTDPGRGGD